MRKMLYWAGGIVGAISLGAFLLERLFRLPRRLPAVPWETGPPVEEDAAWLGIAAGTLSVTSAVGLIDTGQGFGDSFAVRSRPSERTPCTCSMRLAPP